MDFIRFLKVTRLPTPERREGETERYWKNIAIAREKVFFFLSGRVTRL